MNKSNTDQSSNHTAKSSVFISLFQQMDEDFKLQKTDRSDSAKYTGDALQTSALIRELSLSL